MYVYSRSLSPKGRISELCGPKVYTIFLTRHVGICIYPHTYIFICICTHIHIYIYVCIYMYIGICVCMYSCIPRTGVFCNSAIKAAEKDHELVVQSLLQHRQDAPKPRVQGLGFTWTPKSMWNNSLLVYLLRVLGFHVTYFWGPGRV